MKFLIQWLLVAATASALDLDFDLGLRGYGHPRTKHIPSKVANGNINAKFTSTDGGLDGPKLSTVNSTSFDWWYFDVVSPDLNSSLVIIFYTTLPSAFPFLRDSTVVTRVGVAVTFPNNPRYSHYLDATEAVITIDGQGSSGDYLGTGAKWRGTPDLSSYLVTINSPSNGIFGTFRLTSRAPAHYPCSAAGKGKAMAVGPNIGWSNAVPDAIGVADFTVDGTRIAFTGVAYHDKNWSDQPFQNNVASWYWGHARLGLYSIVWFSYLDLTGTEHVSHYISKSNKIISTSCLLNSIKVRPAGVNSDYPPTVHTGQPGGFNVDVELGRGDTLKLKVIVKSVIAGGSPLYTRWTGEVTGRFNGRNTITGGIAVLEQFTLAE